MIPLSETQFRRIQELQTAIDELLKERNTLIQSIVAVSDYYDKDLEVTSITPEGIQFTLVGGDPSSSAEVSQEQLTLKLEE